MILRIRWFLRLSLSCVASLGSAPHAGAAEAQWIEVQSPHFSVVTDAGEKRGREVAMRFEQMRAVFSTLMAKVLRKFFICQQQFFGFGEMGDLRGRRGSLVVGFPGFRMQTATAD